MGYKKSSNFLPSVFQTRTNEKLLRATVDQLISEPEVERLDGYIGRKFNPSLNQFDNYVTEAWPDRQNYQLEPSSVYENKNGEIKFVSTYVDLINKINSLGGNIDNPSRLFAADQYTYTSFMDFDKFTNYSNYYWLPNGPNSINIINAEVEYNLDITVSPPSNYSVVTGSVDNEGFDGSNFDTSVGSVKRLGETGYRFSNIGTTSNPLLRLARGGTYTFNVNQEGHGFFIQTEPGLKSSYSWQDNLNIREVLGVTNNGADVGTVTFNVPENDAQDFFTQMPIQGNGVNLVSYSTKQQRHLRYNEIQSQDATTFLRNYGGIDGQRNLDGKLVLFLETRSKTQTSVAWTANTNYKEDDLVSYSNTVYRVIRDFTSGVGFVTSNLAVYDYENHWNDPDDSNAIITETEKLGWFRISIDSNNKLKLTSVEEILVNKKIKIGEGIQYGNRKAYRTSDNSIKLIPPITAKLDYLYYQDSIDPEVYGLIEIVDQTNDAEINVNYILESSTYTSSNGVEFENGLKVKFVGTTSPAHYEDNEYYVEGVGTKIQLVPVSNLQTPESWLDVVKEPFDSNLFDTISFDGNSNSPKDKQYIVINRGSQEGSAWSRQNRWFHESVINKSNKFNNYTTISDQDNKAKRPIIEFDKNLQLFNFGKNYKQSVTTINTEQTDALSNVQGLPVSISNQIVSSYYSDGVPLVNGETIIFSADLNEEVRKTIYRINWVNVDSNVNLEQFIFTGDSSTTRFDLGFAAENIQLTVQVNGVSVPNSTYQYSVDGNELVFNTAIPNGQTVIATYKHSQQLQLEAIATVKNNDVILSKLGTTYQGTNWYYKAGTWTQTQQKRSNNQEPLFDLFNADGITISDTSAYKASNFLGSKLFGYKKGTGANDTELGFPLSYRSINNVGDIVFCDSINDDTFVYEDSNENTITATTKGLKVRKNNTDGTVEYINQWSKKSEKSKQYQTQTIFATETQTNRFKLDIIPESLSPTHLIVYKNNTPIDKSTYDVEVERGVGSLVFVKDLKSTDKISVKIYSSTVSKNNNWEIPSNLENNAKNVDIVEITLGQMRNHIIETFVKTPDLSGNYQGLNNSKDLKDVKLNGGTILQNAGAPHLANLFLNDVQANFIESLLYNQREYETFKNKFYRMLGEISYTDVTDSSTSLDELLTEMFANKNEMFPFYHSDMCPSGNDYNEISYEINNTEIDTYYLSQTFNDKIPSNRAVLVFLNGTQLVKNLDYTIDGIVITLKIRPAGDTSSMRFLEVNIDDKLEIREYTSTDGFHIPPTPSKLGMYPLFSPEIIIDGYGDNTHQVIRGHDGSKIAMLGDFRDNIILELEKRIYNNVKVTYNKDLINIDSYIPGAFRKTSYSKTEFDNIIAQNFSRWLGKNNVKINDTVEVSSLDKFSWNYRLFDEKLTGKSMPAAYWRGIYNHFYDTEQPNLRPWEMLGQTTKPTWWEEVYGPAPYTSGNKVLWDDLEAGKIAQPGNITIDSVYKRPGLSDIIPVDDSGELLSPYECLSVNNSNVVNGSWKYGDGNPVETAWKHSSEYPFAVQIALALSIPAEYFGLYRDTNDQVIKNNQWQFNSTGTRTKIEQVHGELNTDGTIARTNGYTTWLAEYANSLNYNITDAIGDKLRNIQLRLSYKASGYTDKKFLKFFAEQSSPNSINSSILIPDDDYDIKLFKSSPRQSVVYSGVIVTRSANGFTVSGYDLNDPTFIVNVASKNSDTQVIKVGNTAVEVSATGTNENVVLAYGSELNSVENVVEFLIGYGRFLENQGFKFDNRVEGSNEVHNWKLAAKEFIFWAQQGWDQGISVSLSPIGSTLNFRSVRGAVDSISNRPYGSRIYDNNKAIIEPNNYIVNRDGRNFSIETLNDTAIYLADIDVVDWEHVVVFKNKTQFNDIIYQPESGNRQYRIRISGFRTSAWDGTFGAPGFIINEDNVPQWQAGRNYSKGEIVLFKGEYYTAKESVTSHTKFNSNDWLITEYSQFDQLLPNLANKAGMPKSYYDFNETNLELDPDRLAKGLIGFSQREYLNDLGISDTSQVKFYQGLIRQKGSNNSLNKMLRAKLDNFESQADFFEQWAIKSGNFGGVGNTTEIRLEIPNNNNTQKSPLLIEMLDDNDSKTTGRVGYKSNDLLVHPLPYNKNAFTMRDRKKRVNNLPSAGYAQKSEIDYISPTLDLLGSYIDNNIGEDQYIWVGSDKQDNWNVYKTVVNAARISSIVTDPSGIAILTTTQVSGLEAGDDILIKVHTSSDPSEIDFTGYYRVIESGSNSISVQTDLPNYNRGFLDNQDLVAVIYNLHTVHFDTLSDANNNVPPKGWKNQDKLYIDSATNSGWGVYKNSNVFAFDQSLSDSESTANDGFGYSLAGDNGNNYVLVGAESSNKVQAFQRNITTGALIEDSELLSPSNDIVGFGSVLEAGSNIYAAAGSPLSNSNIGYVHILRRNRFGSFYVDQALAAPGHDANGKFGNDIAISDDGKWMYIGQPGVDKVHAYQMVTLDTEGLFAITEDTVGNGSTTTFALENEPTSIYELKVIVGNKLMIPFKEYTISGSNIVFTTPPAVVSISITYKNYFNHVYTITGASATDFGHRVVTSTDANQIIISATNNNAGTVHVYNRTVENQFATGSTNIFTASVTIQGTPRVFVDDVETTDFTFNGTNTITFTETPSRGSIVKIDTNNFVANHSITAALDAQSGAQYGYSIDLCPNDCSLYVGAPYHDVDSIDAGRVYRYLNQGKFFGKVIGTIQNPTVSVGSAMYFNNFRVAFDAADTLSDVVTKINAANIPGVTALSVGNILTVETDSEVYADKLNLVQETGDFFADMGISVYVARQIINSPQDKAYNNFGKVVKVNNTADLIAISADRSDAVIVETFDNNKTKFDTNSTSFSVTKAQTGGVFIYQFLSNPELSIDNPGQFVFAESLNTDKLDSLDQFGNSIEFTKNTIIAGAPGSDDSTAEGGVVYQFTNATQKMPWLLTRYEKPQVDLDMFNRVFLYDSKTNERLANLDIIDPIKGKVTSSVLQEITYQTSIDPAFYSNTENLRNALTWGTDYVGKVWWDLSQVRYVEYNHDGEEYSSSNWGFTFPGSRIICAEWTESDVAPSEYFDDENPDAYPYNPTNFNIVTEFNQTTQQFVTKYYFWVVGKTRAPRNTENRIYSIYEIEDLISNPTLNGVPFIAFTGANTFALFNVDDLLTDNTVLAIDYDIQKNNNLLHQEYQLINEGDVTSVANEDLITKLIDSLAGADTSGNLVPDIKLNSYLRYGIDFRPRQTMFTDRRDAVKQAVEYFNSFMKTTPVVYSKNIDNILASEPELKSHEYDEAVDNYVELTYLETGILVTGYLVFVKNDETTKNRWVLYELQASKEWVKKRVQVYKNSRYISRVTWTDPNVVVPGNFSKVVEYEYNLRSVVASEGEFVKIKDNGLGLFKVVQKQNDSWVTVQEENSTLKINQSIYKTELLNLNFDIDGFGLQLYDDNPSLEIQKIVRAVYEDFFINEHAIEKNQWFLHMLKYALSKNKSLDFATKTSLIKINQQQRALQQVTVYQKDNQDFIRNYIEETKPYHTKISEFVLQYNSTDNADLKTTDFDLPSYYSFNSNTYRSPTGSTVEDNNKLLLAPWADWTDNYKLEVGSIVVNDGGTYLTTPTVKISGGGGSGATAKAVLNANKITSIVVTNPGSGFISTPTVTLEEQSDNPAQLSAVLVNKKIRSFNTTVKFDRVSRNSGYLVEFKNTINAGSFVIGEQYEILSNGTTNFKEIGASSNKPGTKFIATGVGVGSGTAGQPVDLSNETIFARSTTRSNAGASVLDLVLDIFSNGNWVNDTTTFPALDVPNFRFYNDSDKSSDCTSVVRSRVQFFDSRDTVRGLHQSTLQSAIRALGTTAGINNIDISGTTVTLDGSLIDNTPSVLNWKNNFAYYAGDVVFYNNVFYTVDVDYTSATSGFSTTNLTKLEAGSVISHLDRTWKLYKPVDGMLANDPAQLFNGTVFPGARVLGVAFSKNSGFDSGATEKSSIEDSNDPLYLTTFNPSTDVNITSNIFEFKNDNDESIDHGFVDEEKLYYNPNGNATIGGLAIDTIYYVSVVNSKQFKLTTDQALLNVVNITSVNSGTHKLLSSFKKWSTDIVNRPGFSGDPDKEFTFEEWAHDRFEGGSGFDIGAFDPDDLTIEGVPSSLPSAYDQGIYSRFTDTALGTRPEDIITSGGKFLDPNHSYAPEEHVPGSVYDTLEMFVHTLPTQLSGSTGYSPKFGVTSYTGDGVQTRFNFSKEDVGDYFLVYTSETGPRYRKIAETNNNIPLFTVEGGYYEGSQDRAYSIDWTTGEIVFDNPIADGDILTITRIAQTGENILANKTFTSDGTTNIFALEIENSRIKNSLVLVNGKEVDHSITSNNNHISYVVLSITPQLNDHIHMLLSGDSQNTISKVYTQIEQLEDSQVVVRLDEVIRNNLPKDTTVIAELNGSRLRPSNTAYYDSDGSTVDFKLPNTAKEKTITSLTNSQVRVWVEDVKLNPVQDYTVSAPTGTSVPTVTMFTPPEVGARVSITYTGNADYTINETTNDIELLGVVPARGDLLAVTSFSDHDSYYFETRVFVGTDQFLSSTKIGGFDNIAFDVSEFDGISVVTELDIEYELGDGQIAERLFVSIDGAKMIANLDYVTKGRTLYFADSISVTDTSVIIITEMNKNIYNFESTYSIFNDMNGNVNYYRIAEEEATELARDLSFTATEIELKDASEFPTPVGKTPGVISINGERITYWTKNGNILGQIRRGVAGTGASEHTTGTIVLNMNKLVPDSKCNTWYNKGSGTPSDGKGLQQSLTKAAQFIKDKKGISFPLTFAGVDDIYVDEGYVDEGYAENTPSDLSFVQEDYVNPGYTQDP